MIINKEKLWLIHVPAAAVIHEQQTLIEIIKCITYLDELYFFKFFLSYIIKNIKIVFDL